MIEHDGYIGTIEVDPDGEVLFGRVMNVADDIFYEGETVVELKQNMRDALAQYLDACRQFDKRPDKPFSGDLRLRMDPLVHARLAALSESIGESMNAVVARALGRLLDELEAEAMVRAPEQKAGSQSRQVARASAKKAPTRRKRKA